jgi:hypothetical protein
MSGKRQHHIPQFLLRGFAIGFGKEAARGFGKESPARKKRQEQIWVFHSDFQVSGTV